MKSSLLVAGILSVVLTTGAATSNAADLDYGRIPSDRYGAYDDPRYRDLYGPSARHEPPYYRPAPPAPLPPATVYREPGIYGPEPRRYSQAPDDWRDRNGCLPREEVRRRLVEDGWRDFHDLEVRTSHARVRARRPNGDVFDLKVDRCSGEVVDAQLLQRGSYGPYAEDHDNRYAPRRPYY